MYSFEITIIVKNKKRKRKRIIEIEERSTLLDTWRYALDCAIASLKYDEKIESVKIL